MRSCQRGDVVLVDLGLAAKVRPCLVVSIPVPDKQRNMCVVVPLTTEIRGGEYEVVFPRPPWLKQDSVANVLGIAGIDKDRIQRTLGTFDSGSLKEVSRVLVRVLGLNAVTS